MTSLASDFASARDIAGVLERMSSIEAALPHVDGVAYFNRMYREVTRLVREAVAAHEFVAAQFLERLDVNFANLFFAAYAAAEAGTPVSRAWAPLFDARARPDIQAIQFALAGMNAHISHDLAFAVVDTCREVGVVPAAQGPEHADFTRTNEVLARASEEIKGWFLSGTVAVVDQVAGKVDDGVAMFGIHVARSAAWETSEMLWTLADNPRMDHLFRTGLARTVELTSRGILL